MTFYLKPPRGSTNYHLVEECVKQRLCCYQNLSEETLFVSEYLIEDSNLDRTSHYIFRLIAYRNSAFRSIFINKEQQLFKLRLENLTNAIDIRQILKKLRKHICDGLQDGLPNNIRSFYIILMKICLQMLKNNYLEHALMKDHDLVEACEICKHFSIKVPFQYCCDLLLTRAFNLYKGLLEVNSKDWKSLLLALFNSYILIALREMQFCVDMKQTLQDERLRRIINLVLNCFSRTKVISGEFDITDMITQATLFPVCMQNLYTVLDKTNRLPHNARFDFSLFLKGIGMSLADSLRFWELIYSKKHATCSRCTHSWAENEKRYIYGIRHLYGLEGSRKNYSVRSCLFYQNLTLGAMEEGGCPFKHFDDENMKNLLKRRITKSEGQVEDIMEKRKQHPTTACTMYLKCSIEQTKSDESKINDIQFQNPVEYYMVSKNYITMP